MSKTSSIPVWFLDVDGVINRIARDTMPGFRFNRIAPGNGDGYQYPIRWNPDITGRIREMHESGVIEVQWLTTWGSGANGSLRQHLNLPEFKVAGEPPAIASGDPESYYNTLPEDEYMGWWKLAVVQKFARENPGRPIVWTDDDFAYEQVSKQWVLDKNIFVIAPDQRMSLTMHDLDCIEEFARNGYTS